MERHTRAVLILLLAAWSAQASGPDALSRAGSRQPSFLVGGGGSSRHLQQAAVAAAEGEEAGSLERSFLNGRRQQQGGSAAAGGASSSSSGVSFRDVQLKRTVVPQVVEAAQHVALSHSGRNVLSAMWRLAQGLVRLSSLLPSSREAPEYEMQLQDLDLQPVFEDKVPGAAAYRDPSAAALLAVQQREKSAKAAARRQQEQLRQQQQSSLEALRKGDVDLQLSELGAWAVRDGTLDEAMLLRLLALHSIGSVAVAYGTLAPVPVDPQQKGLLPGMTRIETPLAAHDVLAAVMGSSGGGYGADADGGGGGGSDAMVEITTEPLGVYRPPPILDVVTTADRLPLSSHECFGAKYEHRVCKYHNLVLWNGTLHYIVDELNKDLRVPQVPLAWVELPDFKKEVLKVNVTTRDKLPFAGEEVAVHHVRDALLWLLTYFDNYGHLLGEHGPTMHSMMCTWLGRCEYSEQDLTNFNIILTNTDPGVVDVYPEAIKEMFDCLARDPPRALGDPYYAGKVVVIGTSVAGIGPTCRGFPWCRPRYNRQAPVPHMMLTWKNRMMKCMGLPSDLVAKSERPYLLFINRQLDTGRGFLNLDKIVDHVKTKHPQFDVEVKYVDGMTMRQQAVLYHNASMLIQMHGAALGNMIFLPRGACVVDVVPKNNEDKHPWVIYMGQDFKPLYYAPVIIPPQKTMLMWDKITPMKEYQMLSEEQKRALHEQGKCPKQEERPEFDTYAACNFAWFLKRSNVELNEAHVDSAIMQAINVLNDKDRIKFVS